MKRKKKRKFIIFSKRNGYGNDYRIINEFKLMENKDVFNCYDTLTTLTQKYKDSEIWLRLV